VQQASTLVAAADLILLQLEIPLETVCAAAELAHDHHVPVILNPAPAQSLPSSLLAAVDYLVLNETELSLLADTPIHSISEAVAAARALVDAGSVIFTMGARGSLLITQQDALHIPAFDVDAIDTTAAGDAFIAGFATSLAEGQSMEQAICWGNAAGGLATTILGAQPSLPHRHDVYQLVQSRQHRSQSEKVGGEI